MGVVRGAHFAALFAQPQLPRPADPRHHPLRDPFGLPIEKRHFDRTGPGVQNEDHACAPFCPLATITPSAAEASLSAAP